LECEGKVKLKKQKSNVVRGTDPAWPSDFFFDIKDWSTKPSIIIQVYHSGKKKNMVGECRFFLKDYIANTLERTLKNIMLDMDKGGKIHLTLSFIPDKEECNKPDNEEERPSVTITKLPSEATIIKAYPIPVKTSTRMQMYFDPDWRPQKKKTESEESSSLSELIDPSQFLYKYEWIIL